MASCTSEIRGLVSDLDFSHCVFSKNSDLVCVYPRPTIYRPNVYFLRRMCQPLPPPFSQLQMIDETLTSYYYARIEAAPSARAASHVRVRWSADTKAAILLLLQRLWTSARTSPLGASAGVSVGGASSKSDFPRELVLERLNLVHGPAFNAAFHPQLNTLVRYVARLAVRHGLVREEDGVWALPRFCGDDDNRMEDRGLEHKTRGEMQRAKAWLENVTDQNARAGH